MSLSKHTNCLTGFDPCSEPDLYSANNRQIADQITDNDLELPLLNSPERRATYRVCLNQLTMKWLPYRCPPARRRFCDRLALACTLLNLPDSVEMHGATMSRIIPPMKHVVVVPALDQLASAFGAGPVRHNHKITANSPLSLQHNLSLDPTTKSYVQMVGEQTICSAAHLMMHTTTKGIVFTIIEFFYRTCSPLLSDFSPNAIMTDYVWPLIEKFSSYIASKVRKSEIPDPSAPISAEQHAFTDSYMEMLPLGAGLASVIACLLTGNKLVASASGLKEYKKWTDFGAGLGKIKTAITTVTEFTHWVIEHTRSLMLTYWPDASISSSLAEQFSLHKIDICSYMRGVVALTNPTDSDAVLRDPATPQKLIDLVQTSAQIMLLDANQQLSLGSSTRTALSVMRRDLTTFAQAFSSSRAADAKRPTPYHISLYGKSGVGKSDLVNSLIYDVTDPRWFKTVVDRGDDGRVSVYPRSASDPYWSNYAGQTAVILDDFGQSAQDTVADSEYLSLIFMISGVAFMPRMAAVADKGRHFTSRLVVSTTNIAFPTSLCVKTAAALWRRRNDLVEVTTISDDIDDPDRYRFNLINPAPETASITYIRQGLTYAELLKHIIPKINKFCKRDEKAVLKKTALSDSQANELMTELCVEQHNLECPYEPTPKRLRTDRPTSTDLNCPCCDEIQDNLASICCTRGDYWHPLYAGVPEDVFSHPVFHGACQEYQHSDVTWDFFDLPHAETTPFHTFAFLQALQVGDCVIPPPNSSYVPARLQPYLARFHRATSERYVFYCAPTPDRPARVLWQDMKKIWNLFHGLRKYNAIQYCFGMQCPPRATDYSARLKAAWLDRPVAVEQHSLTVVERQSLDQVRLLFRHLECEMSEMDIQRFQSLSADELLTIHWNTRNSTNTRFILACINERAVFNSRLHRTTDEVRAEMELCNPENVLEEHERGRFARWWASPDVPSLLKTVMTGLTVAAGALVTWKVYNWLSKETHNITTTDHLGNVSVVKCAIEKNMKGYAKDALLLALTSIVTGTISSSMEGAAVGYDGRAKFLRQGRILRTQQHALSEKVSMSVEDMIDAYVKELNGLLSEAQIETFKVRAGLAIRKALKLELEEEKVTMESSTDNRTIDILEHRLKQTNALYASRERNGSRVMINGLGLRGKFALFPFHLFHDLQVGETTELTVSNSKGSYTVALTMGKHIHRAASEHGVLSNDLALVNLGARVPSFTDISKHFISEDDLASMHSTPAVVIGYQPRTGMISQHHSIAKRGDRAIQYGDQYATYLLPQYWNYSVTSFPGFCGATAMCLNTQASGCIMGMHVAGLANTDTSYAAIITREWLDGQLRDFFPTEVAQHCGALPENGPLSLGRIGGDYTFFDATLQEDVLPKYPTITPVGQLRSHAYLTPKFAERVTSKTDLRPSPLFDLVTPHVTEPSVLHPSDSRLETPVSPMDVGAQKYSTETKPQNPLFIERAFRHILSVLLCYTPVGLTKRVLTLHEGINGVPSAEFARMNPLTSPGLPYKWWKPAFAKGKRYLFDCSSDNDDPRLEMIPKDAYLVSQLEDYHGKLLAGEQTFMLSYSNLKDERRSLKKIKSGATRLFDCMPLHFNIECRRFFGAFIACMNQNSTILPSSVGINVLGPQWTDLYNRLNRFGGNVIAGDYIGWDGKFDPDIFMKAVELINAWYDDGVENARARITLAEQMIHLFTVYGNVVAFKTQGIPSGVPITADINGLGNWFYILCCIQSIASDKGILLDLDRLSDNLELAFYGDDHIIAPSLEIQEWFTFADVQKYFTSIGMGYTDALKLGGPQPPFTNLLHDTSYLKRRFAPHHIYPSKILAPIETNTIHEEINWLRVTPTEEHERDAMYQNLETALNEAYYHGNCYYTSLLDKVNHCLSLLREADLAQQRSSGWRQLTTDFRSRDEEWLKNFA